MTPDSIVSAEEFDEPYVFISGYIPLGSIYWRSSVPSALLSMWDELLPEGIATAEVVPDITADLASSIMLYVDSVDSEESVSNIIATSAAMVDSVDSEESVSDVTIEMDLIVIPSSISSEFVAGTLSMNVTVTVDSIGSAEVVGEPTVMTPLQVEPNAINTTEVVEQPSVNYILFCAVNSAESEEALDDVQINQTTNISAMYDTSSVSAAGVSLTYYVDDVPSEEDVSELAINYVEYVTELTIDDTSSVENVTLTQEAIIRADSILSREISAAIEIGTNRYVEPDSITSSERVSMGYLHHPISDVEIGDESAVSDIDVTVHVPPAYPLSILSDELVNNTLTYQANEIVAYAISSDAEVGFPSTRNNGRVDVPELSDGEEFGETTLSLTMTEITAVDIESEEDVSEALLSSTFVLPKAHDEVYSDSVQTVYDIYGDDVFKKERVWDGSEWQWEYQDSYFYTQFMREDSYTHYFVVQLVNEDNEIYYEGRTEEIHYLKPIYPTFSEEQWMLLTEAHQWQWYEYFQNYYGVLDEWILHGNNRISVEANADSSRIDYRTVGNWHVNNPIAEIAPAQEFDGEFFPVYTNLSIVDDRIAELRATSPAGIITTTTPQTVYATISAETVEVTDTLSSSCEYVIQDQVANYELYEGISVSPAFNYLFDVPEPTYIKGIPVLPSLRTDPLCSVDIPMRALQISADAYGKLNFFGVAPDILGETTTYTDYNDELPPTLYKPLKPPYIQPEDPTSELSEQQDIEQPELPDTWDGWEPEDPADDGTGEEPDDGWEEDPAEGVTPTTGVMYKEFPLNLYGGGTVIMSGIPKYKNNGKKKWLFATAKKKQKKTDENGELCVDEQVDDGPRYIGLYIRNGNLVLTDGEFVLRTKAPPRGQRVLVFAGYYGTRSFVGWWMNPKRYKYNYGELTDRSNDKNGPTLIMLGRGWGTKSPGESAGNGFTIGSIKIVDESSEVGSLGYSYSSGEPSNSPGGTFNDFNDLYNQYKSTLPTKTLDAIAQESAIVAPDIYSKDDMDFYVIDTEKPHDPVLEDMYGSIRSAMEEANSIYQKLQQYPNMPYEEKDKAEKALYALRTYVEDMKNAASTHIKTVEPSWIPVRKMSSEERANYMKDYERWKVMPRMIGYFSIDDSSRVGVPGVR